jgi:Zn-dependent protease with chaperone function
LKAQMKNLTTSFPPMPVGADKSNLNPSPSFAKQVYRSVGALLLFVFVYFFLFFGALAIALVFGLLGYAILTANLSFIGLVVGVGFIAAGLLLVFFVIKFLFKRTYTDYSDKVEVNKEEQPTLFAFIDKLTVETGSPKPKKIFITANVNAGVFYNSSFWSMFFPVRKNLQIGLGLVNSVNTSEFKAIMAHEFGHFSQRSMKFGSYVYNLNKVIYDMLFENDSYQKLLNTWARMHMIFRLMAFININIIKGMQAILKKVYVVVNKTYLGLSREMEFHADAVAAYVSGSNQSISSLKRVELGQLCYSDVLDYWNLKLTENKRSDNLYVQHSEVIKLFSRKHNLELDEYGLPVINRQTSFTNNNVIEMDDPWSSHPLTADREERLRHFNLNTETLTQPAWSIFNDPIKLQKKLTDMLYLNASAGEKAEIIGLEEFQSDFSKLINNRLFDGLYRDYYDHHSITPFSVDELILAAGTTTDGITPAELFSDENCNLPSVAANLQQHITTLDQLINIRTDIKRFYYQHVEYKSEDATGLHATITTKFDETVEKIKELDKRIFIFFYNVAKTDETRAQLVNSYRRLFKYQAEAMNDEKLYNDMIATMQPVYGKMQPNQIRNTMSDIYAKEKTVKPRIQEIIDDEFIAQRINAADLVAINTYLKNNWLYYIRQYDSNAINVFNKAMRAYISVTSTAVFLAKESLLMFQSHLIT